MIHPASKQGFAQQGRIGVSSMASYSFEGLKKFNGCNGLLCSSMTDCKVLTGQACTPTDSAACEVAHPFEQMAASGPQDAAADRVSAIPAPDWDLLFHAVQTSLRAAVGVPENAGPSNCGGTAELATDSTTHNLKVKTQVLDCVAVLDLLHRALACERRQHQQSAMISM